MRLFVLIGFSLATGAAVVVLLYVRPSNSSSKPSGNFANAQNPAVEGSGQATDIEKLITQYKGRLTTGDPQLAEESWGDLRGMIRDTDTNAMPKWIRLQVELVDDLKNDPQRRLLRKLAFQQLYLYPWFAEAHQDWLVNKMKLNEFSDPNMRIQLTNVIHMLDRMKSKRGTTNN